MGLVAFEQLLSMLPPWLSRELIRIPEDVRQSATELRLRAGLPAMVCFTGKTYFFSKDKTSFSPFAGCFTPERRQLDEILLRLSEFSLYAHEQELRRGYITVRGGHRIGVCGTYSEDRIPDMFSSINIRIASERLGCANALLQKLPMFRPPSLLVAGPPGSGKTTLLRDLVRALASPPHGFKLAVVDERGELAATYRGKRCMDLGICSDVLDGYPRSIGLEIAARSLAADIAVCDEIGSCEDAAAVRLAALCGVSVAASAHASSPKRLMQNTYLAELLRGGIIEHVVFLSSQSAPGEITGIYRASELC